MRHPFRAFLAVVAVSVGLLGCSQDPACPEVCNSRYDSCIASGSPADVCAMERDSCQRMCTSTPVTYPDGGSGPR